MNAGQKLDTLGMLMMLYGGFQLFVAGVVVLLYGGMGGLMLIGSITEGDGGLAAGGGLFVVMALFVGLILLVYTGMYVAAGVGMRRRKPWSRVLGLIGGALAILSFPIGTALGVYAFMVLLGDDAAKELTG